MHSAVRFAQTKWRIKRHIHPTSISEFILGGGIMAIIPLTFNSAMGYTTGFIALAVIILVKIGLNITRNAVLK